MNNENRKKRRNGSGPSGLLGWAKDLIAASKARCHKHGYKSAQISPEELVVLRKNTTHCCDGCGRELKWCMDGSFKNPHLHHSHTTGEVYGFASEWCNTAEGRIRKQLSSKESLSSQLRWFEFHFPELLSLYREKFSLL